MSDNIEKFLDDLLKDKAAMEAIADKKPQTIEDLAKITGGLASRYGYNWSEEQILSFLSKNREPVRRKTDSRVDELAAIDEKDMEGIAGGGGSYPNPNGCGEPQLVALIKHIKGED